MENKNARRGDRMLMTVYHGCSLSLIHISCSWDPALGEQIGQAMGEEAAAQEVAVLLGPGLNLSLIHI